MVKKPHWSKRLPHYRLKAANYGRRAWWLLKQGMLFKTATAMNVNGRSH
jgi:glycosyl transferase family 25